MINSYQHQILKGVEELVKDKVITIASHFTERGVASMISDKIIDYEVEREKTEEVGRLFTLFRKHFPKEFLVFLEGLQQKEGEND